MTAFGEYLEHAIINHTLRGIAFPSPPTNLYLAMFTSQTDDTSGGTEVSGGGYARVRLSTTGTFGAPDGEGTNNLPDIMFPQATAAWGALTHFALHDAATAGNRLYHGPLTTAIQINAGDILRMESGSLQVNREASIFLSDPFNRIIDDGWGAAFIGETWTRVFGDEVDFDVNGQAGLINFPSAGATRATVLPSVSEPSGDLLYQWSVEKEAAGGYHELILTFRNQDATDSTWYGLNCRRNTDGTVQLLYVRRVSNTQTLIAGPVTVSGVTNVGQALWLRVQYEGTNPTTVRARCWKTGQNEPATWSIDDGSDSSGPQTAGGVGFKGFLHATATSVPYRF